MKGRGASLGTKGKIFSVFLLANIISNIGSSIKNANVDVTYSNDPETIMYSTWSLETFSENIFYSAFSPNIISILFISFFAISLLYKKTHIKEPNYTAQEQD